MSDRYVVEMDGVGTFGPFHGREQADEWASAFANWRTENIAKWITTSWHVTPVKPPVIPS